MKAKKFIIIGGAIALFLLWKNRKDKTISSTKPNVVMNTSTFEDVATSTPSGTPIIPFGFNPNNTISSGS